jgi:hypothetical protein
MKEVMCTGALLGYISIGALILQWAMDKVKYSFKDTSKLAMLGVIITWPYLVFQTVTMKE